MNKKFNTSKRLKEIMHEADAEAAFLFLLDKDKEFVAVGTLSIDDMSRCYFYLLEKILSQSKKSAIIDIEEYN